MFENIVNFFKNIGKKEENKKMQESSKDAAKERLHLVLMQDRANVSADFYLPKNWSLQGRYSASKQAPMLWGTVNTTHRYSFKIDKSLMDGRLNIGVEANSPFSKYSRLEQRVVKPEMETIQTNYITARSFGVYISYTFRKGKRVNIERNNTLKTTDQQTGVE